MQEITSAIEEYINCSRENSELEFYEKIAKNVIKILSPQLVYDEDIIHASLLGPFEKFICDLSENASQDDVTKIFRDLQALNEPSKLCRRVLKTGDVTFSCNDCGLDETCVVCIDCFHKGAHKDHNYRMSTSNGGCCDCGDPEAWKSNYACTDHHSNIANISLTDFEDKELRAIQLNRDTKNILKKLSSFPKGIASRYLKVCRASLQYARMILSWKDYHCLPKCLQIDTTHNPELSYLLSRGSTAKNYFVVVLNDEIHTYDFVIGTFVKIIKCSKMQAGIMAATVSREGRCFVMNDTEKACKPIKSMIANTRDSSQNALKVEIIHGSVLAHQAYALKLIEWTRKMSSLCDTFRILTAYTLLGKCEPILECDESFDSNTTLLEKIMCCNTTYWKMIRVEWNDLFVIAMLTDYSFKQQLARLITRNYPKLMQDFIQDDHDHSVSILTLTTQLYTVPSLICMLIEEENALAIITQTLLDVCKKSRRDPALSFENRKTFDMKDLMRGFYIISDLKNLINIRPTKWTELLRKNVLEAVKIFLNILSMMQGMDSVKRQSGQHLEYEPDWESGMTLQSRLTTFITRLVKYCSFDDEVLFAALRETQLRLLKVGSYKHIASRELFGHQVNCIQYDVSVQPVSVHLPLSRFAAALIIELMARRPSNKLPYDESLVILTEQTRKFSMIDIMEPSLRTEVMVAQFRSGMWRRNGYSLVNQILYFHAANMGREMYDRDILLLQECAAMCDANEFMMHLLNKFQLFDWISSDTIREPLVGPKAVSFQNDEEIMAQIMSLGEEFLQLLLTIINERFRKGLGIVEEHDVIKNEIIQLLCISPATRSDIIIKLGVNDNEVDCIRAVANLKRSTESATGKYELKDEYYDRFNPFFYHYSRRHQSNAIDAQLKRKKNLKEPLICCPPPRPVELVQQFSNLNELLKCDVTLTLIAKILTRALGPPEDAQECSTRAPIRYTASDLQLDQSLHLIGLALFEQERNPMQFRYIQAAHDKNIFLLLKNCYEMAERSKDLILWLMKKTNDLVDTLTTNSSIDDSQRVLDSVKECFKSALSKSDNLKQDNKKRSSELAAKRRERILMTMKVNRDKFLSSPSAKQLVAEAEKKDSLQPDEPMLESDNDHSMDFESTHLSKPCHQCIICLNDQTPDFDQSTMVMLAFVQRSSVLSKNRGQRRIPNYDLTPSNQINLHMLASQGSQNDPLFRKYSFTSDNSLLFDATIMPSDLFFSPHISTCRHVMHYHCITVFLADITKRETSRPNRNARHVSFELEKHEFLCPLCRFICNATIPLLPNYTSFGDDRSSRDSIFSVGREIIERSSENLSAWLSALRSTVDVPEKIHKLEDSNPEHYAQKYMQVFVPRDINVVLQELNEIEALGLRDFINSIKTNELSASTCSENLLSSISTLAERINCVGLDLHKSVYKSQCDRIFMMTSWTISYTIQVYERVARFKGAAIFEDLKSSNNVCLTYLLRFACASMLTHPKDLMRSLLVRKLRYLLIQREHSISSACYLDIDALEMFVSLFILLQKLYTHIDEAEQSDGSSSYESTTRVFDHEYFRNLLHLMLMLNALQVVVCIQNEAHEHEEKNEGLLPKVEECLFLHSFYEEVLITSGHPVKRIPPVTNEFCSKVRRRLLPFLRSCAVFFYHLSQIPPPVLLRTKSAFHGGKDSIEVDEDDSSVDLQAADQEFGAICQYLNLPNNLKILFQGGSSQAGQLAKIWLRHPRVLILIKAALKEREDKMRKWSAESRRGARKVYSDSELMPVKLIRQPHSVNRLIELPYDYSELVDKVSDFTCPSIKNEDSRTPTLCLVCGVMLCSQSYCCQRDLNELASNHDNPLQQLGAHQQQLVGSCTHHAYECSSGVGVFLRIRNCQILFLSGHSKGCYIAAPYIDDHGETDFGLMRGNPLHLNREHYEKLQQMWLTHAIPEHISRELESPDAASVHWHLH